MFTRSNFTLENGLVAPTAKISVVRAVVVPFYDANWAIQDKRLDYTVRIVSGGKTVEERGFSLAYESGDAITEAEADAQVQCP